MKYKCPNNSDHKHFAATLVLKRDGTPSETSPHYARLRCEDCPDGGTFIKWLSRTEYEEVTQDVPEEENTEQELTCPMPSVVGACIKSRCAWWYEMDDCCSVLRIAEMLTNANTR